MFEYIYQLIENWDSKLDSSTDELDNYAIL